MPTLAWPPPLDRLDPDRRNLTVAVALSLFLHAILLSIHFKLPEALNKATEQALDVILVNAKTKTRPTKAQAKAQANLDGGGNTDDNRRAKTPLPVSPTVREGTDVREARQRIAQLEAEQQQMMTRPQGQKAVASVTRSEDVPAPANPTPSGVDLASAAMNLARLEGQIARKIEEYNKRPRKKFIGARVEEYRFAHVVRVSKVWGASQSRRTGAPSSGTPFRGYASHDSAILMRPKSRPSGATTAYACLEVV